MFKATYKWALLITPLFLLIFVSSVFAGGAITIVSDQFTRHNSYGLGMAETGQIWHIVGVGKFGVYNNEAFGVSTDCKKAAYAIIPTKLSDNGLVEVTFTKNRSGARLLFKAEDSRNYYYVETATSGYRLNKVDDGVVTNLATVLSLSGGYADGDFIKIEFTGANLEFSINGTLTGTVTDNSVNGTFYGFGNLCNKEVRFDNFYVGQKP